MDAKVPHIAPLICGSDIENQKTRSQEFSKSSWACESHGIRTYIHHCVVLGVIGRPLREFKSILELTTAVRDALEAHSKAYSELNILHGDISSNNILLTDDGHGILIDWDISIDVENEERTSLTGSWQFISASRLRSQGKKIHELSDDLESFVYVLVYHLIRCRTSGAWSIEKSLNEIFYPYSPGEETFHDTFGKTCFFSGGYVSDERLEENLNKTFAWLVGQLPCIFYLGVYTGEDNLEPGMRSEALGRLKSSCFILGLFDTALAGAGWPANDGCRDVLRKSQEEKDRARGICRKVPTEKRSASIAVEDGLSR